MHLKRYRGGKSREIRIPSIIREKTITENF